MANPTAGVPQQTTPFAQAKMTRRDLAATAATYYIGEAIGVDASGNAVKCDDTAPKQFAGFAAGYSSGARVTVEAGDAAGDKWVDVERPRYAVVAIDVAAARADVGKKVFWRFSNSVSQTAGTNSIFAGYINRVPGGKMDSGGLAPLEVEIELCAIGSVG